MVPNRLPSLLAAMLCALCAAGCSDPGDIHRFDFPSMGTRAQGEVYVWDRTVDDSPVQLVRAAFDSVEVTLSAWRDDSELGRFNAAPVGSTVTVSRMFSTCLRVAEDLHGVSDGAFDPSVGPLVEAWGFRGGEPRRPSAAELAAARTLLGGYEHDPFKRTLVKTRAGTELDLGGVAKGYAVDWAVHDLVEFGISSALIDLGGTLFALGLPEDRDAWRVGIRDPLDPDELFAAVGLVNRAAATSGGYERFVDVDGRRHGHILDPTTGEPAEGLLSATVIARDAILADALSTTLFVLGPERARRLLREVYPHVDAVLVAPGDGPGRARVIATDGLRGNLALQPGYESRFALEFMEFR